MAAISTSALPPKSRNIFYPPPPTAWERFKWNPVFFTAKQLYTVSQSTLSPIHLSTHHPSIKIVCISDTHNNTPSVPSGDILLHAGDLTNSGSFSEMQAQLNWLNSLPHTHKVVIAGNHDLILDTDYVRKMAAHTPSLGGSVADLQWGSVIYLQHSSVKLEVHGRELNVYGNPNTPAYGNWAFQYPRTRDLWKGRMPMETDILLCHGPPRGNLDLNRKGCVWLQKELWRVRPRLVVCGHIHGGRGREDICWDYVQRVYDCIASGERGWLGVLEMAVAVAWGIIWRLIAGERNGSTTLVNAAVTGERDSEMGWKHRVIEI